MCTKGMRDMNYQKKMNIKYWIFGVPSMLQGTLRLSGTWGGLKTILRSDICSQVLMEDLVPFKFPGPILTHCLLQWKLKCFSQRVSQLSFLLYFPFSSYNALEWHTWASIYLLSPAASITESIMLHVKCRSGCSLWRDALGVPLTS